VNAVLPVILLFSPPDRVLNAGVRKMAEKEVTSVDPARRWLSLSLETAAVAGFLVMCISLILQVVFRYVLQIVAPWTEELARFACIWSTFLGAAICFEERAHIKIDFVIAKVSRKATSNILLFIDIIVTSTFIVVVFYGSILLLDIAGADTATTLPIRMWLVYLVLPISMGSIAIFGILRLWVATAGMKNETEVAG
jgi:TRAP-type C4-dicarboxylate transport system permease small subunit